MFGFTEIVLLSQSDSSQIKVDSADETNFQKRPFRKKKKENWESKNQRVFGAELVNTIK